MIATESMDGVFIDVEVDQPAASDPELAKKLEEVCPVNIFRATASGTEIVPGQLDECVLCNLCVEAAPEGSVRIIRKYEQ
jgi:NAD-dependent dihydropyrimidine dehydrogenase PreA subunit